MVTVTDTPLARETDYGRVDDHSSAIRTARRPAGTPSTACSTTLPPAPTRSTGSGQVAGSRVSSSASDSTALPNVAPATGPAAAIDGDSSTSWVSNALQSAVGQWLQVDFDHPVTNATITVTPSATAVGAQVRRIEVSTVNGTSTLRFDEAGKPLTAAMPYGETPWVRITAVGDRRRLRRVCSSASPTSPSPSTTPTASRTRSTCATPCWSPGHHRIRAVAQWDLGSELLGRPGCAESPDGDPVRGGDGVVTGGAGEPEPDADGAGTDGGDADGVGARAAGPQSGRPGQRSRARARATGDADPIDVLGSAYAAADGDPDTAWTAPQGVVQHRAAPTLTLKLPGRREVAALRVAPSSSRTARPSDAGGRRPRRRTAGAPAVR